VRREFAATRFAARRLLLRVREAGFGEPQRAVNRFGALFVLLSQIADVGERERAAKLRQLASRCRRYGVGTRQLVVRAIIAGRIVVIRISYIVQLNSNVDFEFWNLQYED
jgi:hypothetical protein